MGNDTSGVASVKAEGQQALKDLEKFTAATNLGNEALNGTGTVPENGSPIVPNNGLPTGSEPTSSAEAVIVPTLDAPVSSAPNTPFVPETDPNQGTETPITLDALAKQISQIEHMVRSETGRWNQVNGRVDKVSEQYAEQIDGIKNSLDRLTEQLSQPTSEAQLNDDIVNTVPADKREEYGDIIEITGKVADTVAQRKVDSILTDIGQIKKHQAELDKALVKQTDSAFINALTAQIPDADRIFNDPQFEKYLSGRDPGAIYSRGKYYNRS
jgi:hypothetical protein